MWLPDLADTGWVRHALTGRAQELGLAGSVDDVRLVDVRISNPHRPESPLCRGWATYVVTTPGVEPVHLYLKGYADRDAWAAASPSSGGIPLPGLELVVWRFPDDPRLPALTDLVDPAHHPDVLPAPVREALDGPGTVVRSTVVRYQPEASATLRVEARPGGSAVYAKHLAEGPVGDVAGIHRALWTVAGLEPALRVAEPLATDDDRSVLWTRGVAGAPLTDAVPAPGLPAAVAPVGALLAALHGSGVEPEAEVGVDGLVAEMRKKARKIAAAHPDAGPAVTALAERAAGLRGSVRREVVCTSHGDFHLDQLVTSPDGPVLVDLDSMVRSVPELDLAEFLVDLALRRLPVGVAEEVAAGLVASYAAAAGRRPDPALLQVCADAEFVNRCYRHLRRRTPGWRAALDAELARHEDVSSLLGVGVEVTAR